MKKLSKILKEQQTQVIVNAPSDEIQALQNLQSNLPGLQGNSTIENLGYGQLGPIMQNIEGKLYTAGIHFKSKKSNTDYWVLYDGKIVKLEGEKYTPYVKDGKEMYYDNYQNFAVRNLVNPYGETLKKFGLVKTPYLYEKLGQLQEDLNKITTNGAIGDILFDFNNLLTYFYPKDNTKRLSSKTGLKPTDMDPRKLMQNYKKCDLNRYSINVEGGSSEFYIPKGETCGLISSNFEISTESCRKDLIDYFVLFLNRREGYDEDNIKDFKDRITQCKRSGMYEGQKFSKKDFPKIYVERKNNPFRDETTVLDFCNIAEIISQVPLTDNEFNIEPITCDRKERRMYRKAETKTESLDKIIKKTLMEASENKKRIIQEEKIISSRFNFILENMEPKTKQGRDEIYMNILSEMIYLDIQGFDKKVISEQVEGVFGVLSNLFGRSTSAIADSFKEKGVEWIVEKLGFGGNSYMKNFLITGLGNVNIMDIPKLFTNCEFLTKKIAETIPEAYLRKLEYQKGIGGMFTDVVRNTLYDVIRESSFAQKLEASIAKIVCPLVTKLTGMFSNKLSGMKTKLVGA